GATASLRGRYEMGCGGARDEPGATDVERHDFRPERIIGLGQRLARDQRTGVVDQHVQSAEKPYRFAHELLAFCRFGEIGGSVSVPSAERFRFSLQSAGGIGAAAVVNEDVAAGREQLTAGGETDTLGACGDECAFAVELMHVRSHGKTQASSVGTDQTSHGGFSFFRRARYAAAEHTSSDSGSHKPWVRLWDTAGTKWPVVWLHRPDMPPAW